MQNMKDKEGKEVCLEFQQAMSDLDRGKHHSSRENSEI